MQQTQATNPITDAIEEKLAHLERMVEDLSSVIARQDKELALVTRRVQMLMEREAEREIFGDAPEANVPPPHW